MFDLDEGFHALQNLDAEGRKALMLAGKLWEEIYRDGHQHVPAPLMRRYLTEFSERSEQVRVLRERLDDVLDSREQAELRAEKAERVLVAMRALATHWGLADELDRELAQWRPHCRRAPRSFVHEERIDQLTAEVQSLRRESKASREAEFVAIEKMRQERTRTAKAVEAEHRAFRIAEHERDRAVAAEHKCDELRDEIGRLRTHLDF